MNQQTSVSASGSAVQAQPRNTSLNTEDSSLNTEDSGLNTEDSGLNTEDSGLNTAIYPAWLYPGSLSPSPSFSKNADPRCYSSPSGRGQI